jgi:hypothetical protein
MKPTRPRPVRSPRPAGYPDYEAFRPQRQRVLRLLAAGGVAVALGGLTGCDTVRGWLGMQPQSIPLPGQAPITHVPLGGDMVEVEPPADDDSADEGDDDSAR